MSDESKQYVIKRIKKIKKGGHHGGAWKIAYADFVTAMMTFFLLMWLLSMLNKYQLQGVSEYFKKPLEHALKHPGNQSNKDKEKEKYKEKPNKVATEQKSLADKPVPNSQLQGQQLQAKSPATLAENKQLPSSSNASAMKNVAQQANVLPNSPENKSMPNSTQQGKSLPAQSENKLNPNQISPKLTPAQKQAIAEADKKNMQEIQKNLEKKMQTDPQLREFKNLLNFKVTADGLKIELRDLKDKPMFTTGKADFQKYAQKIMTSLSEELNKYPNRVVIIGHTDTAQYARDNYTNWELSVDRANATRRALIQHGMDKNKLIRVIGVGDTDLLDKTNGLNPSNRRIEVLVMTNEAMRKLSEDFSN